MPNPSRNEIYEAVIRRMVKEALQTQEDMFASEHGSDSEDALILYLQQAARKLGHIPWPREIVGGTVIEKRFGSWDTALERAGLPMPTTQDKVSHFARVEEEIQRQKVIYRAKKAAKKERNLQRMRAQKEKQSTKKE